TGRESRQRPLARREPWVSRITNKRQKLDQPNSVNVEESLRYFLRFLHAYWGRIALALLGMVVDAVLGVMRPWPLKVVVDRVLAHKPSRVPLIHHWLDAAAFTSMQIVYGCCAAVLLLWVNWRFALATLSVSPLMFWLVYRHKLLIKRATRKARASTGLLAALAQETLASIRIVQGLAQEDQIDDRFQVQSENTLQ